MLRAIDRRTHNQYAMEAGLHGLKIPFRHNKEVLEQMAKDEDVLFDNKQVERAILDAQKRVKARYV